MKKEKCCFCNACGSIQIKKGWICDDCVHEFPLSIQSSIADFTPEQLLASKKIFKRAFHIPWISSGGFALTKTGIHLNGFEYELKDIVSVNLNFHPYSMDGTPGYARGAVTLVIETKHFMFEEKFLSDNVRARYHINGTRISYVYPNLLVKMLEYAMTAILNGTYDMSEVERSTEYNAETEHSLGIEEAKKIFGITGSYTMSQLKGKRNELAKKTHPDAGGDPDQFKQVMRAYSILSQFASK